MKQVKLNAYQKSSYPTQNLSVKIINEASPTNVLATTESYPSTLPLPITLALTPKPEVHLYKDHITVQLWGDVSGLIASSTIDMKEYKIIYPIDMETKNSNVSFSVMGSWE